MPQRGSAPELKVPPSQGCYWCRIERPVGWFLGRQALCHYIPLIIYATLLSSQTLAVAPAHLSRLRFSGAGRAGRRT